MHTPARLDQIRRTEDGDFWEIRLGENEIADQLAEIDAGLRLRFSRSGECWIVAHHHHGDCPCNRKGQKVGDSYFVTSVQANKSAVSGIWTGLDQRLVKRIEEINPLGRRGYDLAAELELSRRERERVMGQAHAERNGAFAEQMAHALRKDLGLGSYKGRIFKSREVGK